MKSIKLLLTLAILGIGSNALGQDVKTSTLRWNVTNAMYLRTGEMIGDPTILISSPGKVEWQKADGSVRLTAKVVEIRGTWSNGSAPGQILFQIESEGKQGTLQFTRDNTGIKMVWTIFKEDLPEIIEFIAAGIEP